MAQNNKTPKNSLIDKRRIQQKEQKIPLKTHFNRDLLNRNITETCLNITGRDMPQ